MESSNTSASKAIIAVIVIALIAIAATTAIIMSNNKSNGVDSQTAVGSTSGSANSNNSSSTNTNATVNSATTFKDGTYSATSRYDTPGGGASIGVTVTLSNGTITDASLTQGAPDREAQEFQDRFESGYKSQVVGKKITEVSLSRVAGSSLTPIGFNNAINDIENQAKA